MLYTYTRTMYSPHRLYIVNTQKDFIYKWIRKISFFLCSIYTGEQTSQEDFARMWWRS